jgi:hypothetical protein
MHDLREELWMTSSHVDNCGARSDGDTIIGRIAVFAFPLGSETGYSPSTPRKIFETYFAVCAARAFYNLRGPIPWIWIFIPFVEKTHGA